MILFALLTLADGPREFPTIQDAAVFALTYSAHRSEYYEYGGQIVQMPDGKYAAAYPRTTWEGDHVSFSADPIDYQGKIVASYHTHPCLPFSHYPSKFSPDDLSGFRVLNHPGYMLDMCTGAVHFWAPGDPVDVSLTGNTLDTLQPQVLATGRIVAHIKVTGAPLEAKD